jgi:hypothetical protein
MAVPWLRRLVASLSPQRLGFDPSSVYVRLWTMWHWNTFFSHYFCFILSVLFHQCSTFIFIYIMNVPTFYGKGPHPLLCAGSRAASGKTTISGIPNRLNYCVMFTVSTKFTYVAAGRIIQLGGLETHDLHVALTRTNERSLWTSWENRTALDRILLSQRLTGLWIGKDLEGSGSCLIDMLSCFFSSGTEKRHVSCQSGTSSCLPGFEPDTSWYKYRALYVG